ncbi:MAG: SCO family protein [Sandaracinaceae bacterium]
MSWRARILALPLVAVLGAAPAVAQPNLDAPPGLEGVDVTEHLEAQVPLDHVFRDHTGERVRLGDLLDGERPVLLTLVYHQCPNLCSLVLDGVVDSLVQQVWTVGDEFDVVTLSVDPRDTPEVAADKRRRILRQYGRAEAEEGWHFLVPTESMTDRELVLAEGRAPGVTEIAEAIGFRYQWMPREGQFAHPGVIMLLTPDGRVARYLYGLSYPMQDVRLGLLEASEGRSISTVERVLLFCFTYDREAQGYVLVAWRVMRIGGAICALLLIGILAFLWRREIRRHRRHARAQPDSRRLDEQAAVRS